MESYDAEMALAQPSACGDRSQQPAKPQEHEAQRVAKSTSWAACFRYGVARDVTMRR